MPDNHMFPCDSNVHFNSLSPKNSLHFSIDSECLTDRDYVHVYEHLESKI